MSAVIWIDFEAGKSIDLGNTIVVFKEFSNMGRAAGPSEEYPELFGVIDAILDQEDVDPEWLANVRDQAKRFLALHGPELSADAREILHVLTTAGEEAAEADRASNRQKKGKPR